MKVKMVATKNLVFLAGVQWGRKGGRLLDGREHNELPEVRA